MTTQIAEKDAATPPANSPAGLESELERFRTQNGRDLAALSSDSPVLVVFLRHFGCTFCREALADISERREQIESEGVRIVLVHMMEESSDTAAEFERFGLADVDRVSDPDRALYQAFELAPGTLKQLLGPRVWIRGVMALMRGHGAGGLKGDGQQMPGTFLVHRGRIVKAFRHRTAADRPDYAAMACGLNQEQ